MHLTAFLLLATLSINGAARRHLCALKPAHEMSWPSTWLSSLWYPSTSSFTLSSTCSRPASAAARSCATSIVHACDNIQQGFICDTRGSAASLKESSAAQHLAHLKHCCGLLCGHSTRSKSFSTVYCVSQFEWVAHLLQLGQPLLSTWCVRLNGCHLSLKLLQVPRAET